MALSCAGCGFVGIEEQQGLFGDDGDKGGTVAGLGDGDAAGDGDGDAAGDGDGDGDGPLGKTNRGLGGEPNSTGGAPSTGGVKSSGGTDATGGTSSGGTDMGTGGTSSGGTDATGGTSSGGTTGHPAAILWETLEAEELPQTPFQTSEASMQLVENPVHGGVYALAADQGEESEGRVIISEPIEPQIPGDVVHTRVWVYIPALSEEGRVDFYRLGSEDGGSVDFGVYEDGRLSVYFNGEGISSSSPAGRFPFDQWVCLETRTEVDEVVGRVRLSLDGSTILNSNPENTAPGGSLDYFAYGILGIRDEQSDALVYFDDLVVDSAPIGCE